MSDTATLFQNVETTVEDVGVMLSHAQQVTHSQRTTYYRSALFLSASIAEAILYELIRRHLDNNPELCNVKTSTKYKKIHTLPRVVRSDKQLVVCEKETHPFRLGGQTGFKEMNEFALNAELITRSIFNRLENVRKRRNEIHLHALSSSRRNFTKRDIEKTANVTHLLVRRLP